MVKHIVMFRFKDDVDENTRKEVANSFRKGILELKDVIPTIGNIEVGFNINHGEQWNICLNSEFRTLEDVIDYGKNPNHVKVA